MLVQPGLCRTCWETTLLVFPRGGSFLSFRRRSRSRSRDKHQRSRSRDRKSSKHKHKDKDRDREREKKKDKHEDGMEEGEIEEEETKKKVPLSLEELLAKKKAEEAALSKVKASRGYKYKMFSFSTSLMKFFLLINVKMPAIVDFLS